MSLKFRCWYCPAEFGGFAELVKHFEAVHRPRDEYIVLEVTEDMYRRKEQDDRRIGKQLAI